jgi:predicted acylesterase/phospholipase RssA
MPIKHIVIPGGGPIGFQALGAIQYLEQNNFFKIDNIETLYATSIGTVIAVLIALKFDNWDIINDYMIKRPWQNVFQIDITQIFNFFSNKGIFDINTINIFFKPLLNAKDLPMDITLKQFYEYSNIELHIFSLEINKFEVIDCSYITHPDLSLINAVHMSCAVPVLFAPVCIDNKCYIDGGVVCNDPLNYCIKRSDNMEDIFALSNYYTDLDNNNVNDNSSILDFLMNIIHKLIINVSEDFNPPHIPHQLTYDTRTMSLSNLQDCLSSSTERQKILDYGKECARKYLENITNKDSVSQSVTCSSDEI